MEDIIQVDDAKVQRIVRKIILKEKKKNKDKDKDKSYYTRVVHFHCGK